MRFLSVSIDGFGGIERRSVRFEPGLQIFYGLNEAGKSTTVRALTAGLFGWDLRKKRDKELSQRYKPWSAQEYAVAVEFQAGDSIHRIHRNFSDGSVEGWVLGDGGWKPVQPGDSLSYALGIQDESLFRSLLVFSQTEIGELDKKRVGEAISAKLTGSGDDIPGDMALEALRKRIAGISKKGQTSRTHGELQAVEVKLADLRERSDRALKCSEEIRIRREEMAGLEASIRGMDQRLSVLLPVIEGHKASEDAGSKLETALEESRRAEAKLKVVEGMETDLRRAMEGLSAFTGSDELFSQTAMIGLDDLESRRLLSQAAVEERKRASEKLIRELEKAQRQLASACAALNEMDPSRYAQEFAARVESLAFRLEDLMDQSSGFRSNRNDGRNPFVSKPAIFSAIPIGVIGILLIPILGARVAVIGAVIALGLTMAGIHLVLSGDRSRGIRRNPMDRITSMRKELEGLLDGESLGEYRDGQRRYRQLLEVKANAESIVAASGAGLEALGLDDALKGLRGVEAEIASRLGGTGFGTLEEYRGAIRKYRSLKSESERLRRELGLVLEGVAKDEWERAALDALGVIRYENTLLTPGMSKVDLSELVGEVKALQEAKAGSLTTLERSKGRLEQLVSADQGDYWALAAELDEFERRRDELSFELSALTVAHDVLGQVLSDVQGRLIPDVCRRAGELVSAMTLGRYSDIRMSNGNDGLNVEVTDPSTARWVDPGDLSTGTRDQVYIALRIALAENLTGKPSLPFILDDPFVNYDSERFTAALMALEALGERHQIILFTKDEGVVAACKGICRVETLSPMGHKGLIHDAG